MNDSDERLRALDPAGGEVYAHHDPDAMISRIVREPRTTRGSAWRRFQYRVAGAVAASVVVIVAAIAALQGAGSNLAILSISSSSASGTHAVAQAPVAYGSSARPISQVFRLSVGPTLSGNAPSSPSYRLVIPASPAGEAARVAAIFAVGPSAAGVVASGTSWTVTSPSGRALNYQSQGLPHWYFSATTPKTSSATVSGRVPGPLPTHEVLASDVRGFLAKLGYGYHLTSPDFFTSTTRATNQHATSVRTESVVYTVAVGEVATNESLDFSVNATNHVVYASGPAFRVAATVDYPLQSPRAGVEALIAAQRSALTKVASPSGSAATTPRTVRVTVDAATLTLAAYQLTGGTWWLLPYYQYSDVVTTKGVTAASGPWSALAVDPHYARLGAG